jgi:hypothetical protein
MMPNQPLIPEMRHCDHLLSQFQRVSQEEEAQGGSQPSSEKAEARKS